MHSLILFFCSRNFKRMVRKRAHQLNMDIPVYLKYLVIKDIENEPDT